MVPSPRNSGFSWPTVVDAGVGFLEGPAKGREDAVVGVLQIQEGDVANGLGAGFLADGVAAHAVGDDENVPVGPETRRIRRGLGGARVLIVAPLHPHIREGRVSDRLKCRHQGPLISLFSPSSLSPSYSTASS